jgi:putative transposase|tara:strand:- start:133 stop:1179 length:1047 start_codon:yes stop_codon:yes gene_type:complete
MINKYVFQGMKRDVALVICGVTKHQYYYRSNNRKQGLSASTSTFRQHSGQINKVDNQVVVEEIKYIHKDPDTVYGYHKMTSLLAILGYIINHKKVYRLMFEHQLLQEKHAKPSKTHVKYRKVFPTQPLEVLEMDIKFVWVEEFKRHAYVLSVIDTFTRVLLHGHVGYSIKKEHVKKVWEHVIVNHLQPHDCLHKQIHIEVRNDNDSRFSAKEIQKYFKENQLNQVFTHPYTPQENGHIESFHAILSKKLKPYHFWSIEQLEQVIILFYDKYNNQRLHSSICNLPPNIFVECWNKDLIKVSRDEKKRTIRFKLKIKLNQISDNTSLKCSSSQDFVIPPVLADEQNLILI